MALKLYILLFSFALVNSYYVDKTNKQDYLAPKGSQFHFDESDDTSIVEDSTYESDTDESGTDESDADESDTDESGTDESDTSWYYPDSTEPASTTSSEEIPTTTSPGPRKECPEGQSSLYEKDLVAMISYFAHNINFTENLNASYYETAVEYRDADLKSLIDFIMKFENRPKHLDHIIEDLAETRTGTVEPLVKEVVSKRPEFYTLSQIHQQHTETSQAHLNKLKKSKQICELNCPTESRKRYKRSIGYKKTASQDEYYCANVKEVSVQIISQLRDFQNDFAEDLHNMVVNAHNLHEQQIEEMKSKLKEAAVKEFGATMYDVLSLQDEYNHFIKLVRDENGINNVETQLSETRKNNLEIEFKTEQLRTDLEKYRKYCLTCDSNHYLRLRRDASDQWDDSEDEFNYNEDDVLARLLNDYLLNIKNQFESDHASLLEELNEILSDQDKFIQLALHKLEPIKENVKKDLEHEEEELNNLKSLAPEALIEDLSKLKQDTNSLNQVLQEALDFIHGVVR